MGAANAALDALHAVQAARRLRRDRRLRHRPLARSRGCATLPVEVLKVDRSFVDGLGTEPEDSAVVAAILSARPRARAARDRRGRRDAAAGQPADRARLRRSRRASCGRPPCPRTRSRAQAALGTASRPRVRRPPRRAQPGRRDDAPDRDRQGGAMTSLALAADRARLHRARDHHRLRAGRATGATAASRTSALSFGRDGVHLRPAPPDARVPHLVSTSHARRRCSPRSRSASAPALVFIAPARRGRVRRPRRPADPPARPSG